MSLNGSNNDCAPCAGQTNMTRTPMPSSALGLGSQSPPQTEHVRYASSRGTRISRPLGPSMRSWSMSRDYAEVFSLSWLLCDGDEIPDSGTW